VAKKKTYEVPLQSEVPINAHDWAFKHPEEPIGGAGNQVVVKVQAGSDEEAVELAVKTVEDDFPNTKGKLSLLKKPRVPTKSVKYVEKKEGAI
jgi:hypothetical protein